MNVVKTLADFGGFGAASPFADVIFEARAGSAKSRSLNAHSMREVDPNSLGNGAVLLVLYTSS
jgi:hypothetical protein